MRLINGVWMMLDKNVNGVSQELYYCGIREPLCTGITKMILKRGMVCLDIGANIGYYALLEAKYVGDSGHVYAFEPVKFNFEWLLRNIRLNRFRNISVYQLAVSDRCGKLRLNLSRRMNWHYAEEIKFRKGVKIEHYDSGEVVEVDSVSIDSFVSRHGISRVNFVRMDIEGFEDKVISGMLETVRRAVSPFYLFIEFHPKYIEDYMDTLEKVFYTFDDCGLRPYALVYEPKRLVYRDLATETALSLVLNEFSEWCHLFFEKKGE